MIGLNAGLEIARKALSSYQLAMTVYGNNIANVDTPGYSRRTLLLGEGESLKIPAGRVGLGVDAITIRRMRDSFLDDAFRRQSTSLGMYESLEQTLAEVEMVFGEPGESGLSTALNEFWDSWQDLANQPESHTVRALVKDNAQALARVLHQMDRSLVNQVQALDTQVDAYVSEINSMAAAIADYNARIISGEASGHEATDLRDQRDLLVDELSSIVEVQVFQRNDGSLSVMMGSEALVERADYVRLSTASVSRGGIAVKEVRLGDISRDISPAGGELGGVLQSRDEIIPRYRDDLDEIARSVVEAVNTAHRGGYALDGTAGRDFFDPAGVTAATIDVSGLILNDVNLIAASSDGSVGNGDNALAIAGLRYAAVTADGSTVDDYYASVVGSLGVASASASESRKREELLVLEIEARRESVKGVSIDEEMTNLIAAQHAYEAAAKVVNIVDEMMDTVLSML
jgi:flagellar hook-associated protein 1 FlgK